MRRRYDFPGGVLLVERGAKNILLDIPRGRLPLAGLDELNEVIGALHEVREELIEGAPIFANGGTGHA